jgi:hypothetical protein
MPSQTSTNLLLAQRAEWQQEKDALMVRVRNLDGLLRDLDGVIERAALAEPEPSPPPLRKWRLPSDAPPTVEEAVLVILADGEPRKVKMILDLLGRMAVECKEPSLRSIISKMVRAGKLVQVDRGLYALNAEPPTE